MMAIEALMARHGLEPIARWPAHADWRGDGRFDEALRRARLVIVNGEGTIHHDRPAGRRLLEVGGAAKSAGVPAALINTGWECNGPELVEKLADFALVSARDSRSAEAMRAGGAGVRVVPDLSLVSPVPAPKNERRSGIGFTDNVDRFKALALDDCRRAVSGTTVAVVHRGEQRRAAFLRDGLSLRADPFHPIRAFKILQLRHRLWRAGVTDRDAFLRDLSGLELLVTGRFHAATLALRMRTPFVTQASNTGKMAAFIADAGLAPWRINTPLEREAVLDAARRGWDDFELEAAESYLADAQVAAQGLFSDLKDLSV